MRNPPNPKTVRQPAEKKSQCVMSRPSDYTPSMAAEICAQIGDGKSLRTICKAERMPSAAAVYRWLAHPDHAEFREQYARAREQQADAIVEECLEIADDGSNDWMETEKGPQLNSEHIQRSRLRCDQRKWWAARLAPKKYGDKVEQKHVGANGESLTITRVEHVIVNVSAGDLIERATEPALIEGTYSSD